MGVSSQVMTLRVAVVTSSRADWSHLRRPVAAFHDHSRLEPILVATAAMVDHDYGSAIAEVEAEGYEVPHRIPCLGGDRDVDMAASGGRAQLGFAQCFAELRPDVALVTADRFEMLAPAIAAMTMRIPIVHVEGGEASLGVIDHAIRNALTQLASIHMVTTTEAARRLQRMGEEPWRIHQVGAASLDTFVHDPDVGDDAVSQAVGQPVDASTILVAVHPVTLDEDPIAQDVQYSPRWKALMRRWWCASRTPMQEDGPCVKLGRRFVQNVPTPPKWSTFPRESGGAACAERRCWWATPAAGSWRAPPLDFLPSTLATGKKVESVGSTCCRSQPSLRPFGPPCRKPDQTRSECRPKKRRARTAMALRP